MFTIKWIASTGAEMIYASKGDIGYTPGHAEKEPTKADPLGQEACGACVSFTDADGVHCSIDSGEIFVMNAHGATVSRYVLSTKEFPHGLAPRQAA